VFCVFISSAAASALLVTAACLVCLVLAFSNGAAASAEAEGTGVPGVPVWGCLGLGVWAGAAAAYLCALASFHAWLVGVGATTGEYLRAQRAGQTAHACAPQTVARNCANLWTHEVSARAPQLLLFCERQAEVRGGMQLLRFF
jgi:hypothetical protein